MPAINKTEPTELSAKDNMTVIKLSDDRNISVTVSVYPIESKYALAMVNLNIGGCFAIGSITLKKSNKGELFLAFPQYKNNKNEYKDIAFPLSKLTRQEMLDAVIAVYTRLP